LYHNKKKKKKKTLLDASKEDGLEVNTGETMYMLMSHYQNTGQNCNIKIANKAYENVTNFKYLGMTVISQNYIHKEIKSKLNFGSSCYHSVQNFSM
jgi:hypothetical protein